MNRRMAGARMTVGLAVAALALGAPSLLPTAPANGSAPGGGPAAGEIDRDATYETLIRRSEGGVPNIKADDYASLGFGTGYAMAEDNVCAIADLVTTFSAERAERLGATPANISSDSFYQLFVDRGDAEEPLEARQAAIFKGAAAGFNRYLRDTGVDAITDPACQGASWLRPITELDLRRISRMPFFLSVLSPQFVAAAPPAAGAARSQKKVAADDIKPEEAIASLFDEWRGSNAVALGKDATAGGTGMLLANPHLSWTTPAQRMYALHQTIPGEMNMTGATTLGRIQVAFGATEHVAWTATVSPAADYTFYQLDLVPGKPTHYLFDGEERAMTQETVSIEVPDGDGGHTTVEHTFYSTHYGARLVGGPGFAWTEETAYAVRSTDPAWRGVESLNETWQAETVEEYADLLAKYQSQTTNIIVADSSGGTYYTDANPIPYFTEEQQADCVLAGRFDGSRSECMWQTDPTAAHPHSFGPEKTPHLFRDDFVSNMNDSHWLTNPAAPLTGYDASFGTTGTQRTLRTRSGLSAILGRLAGTDGGVGNKFTLSGLQKLMFDNTAYTGVILRDGMVELCAANTQVTRPDSTVVDISEACDVLRDWDLREDLASRGAHLFREILAAGGAGSRLPASWNYLVDFDPADPVNTPRDLDPQDNPAVLQAIATAVTKLRSADVALDARLGDVQYVTRNGERIPMHGGNNSSGQFNIVQAPFVAARSGYPEVTAGASWIQASEFRAGGLVSKGVLAFSQSMNPNSPYFSDMTKKFSKKQWVDLPFTEADVAANAITSIYLTEDVDVCASDGWREGFSVDFADEADCVAHYAAQRDDRLQEYDERHAPGEAAYVGKPLTIKGKARAGHKIKVAPVSPQAFTPAAAQVTYQWLRDGTPIPGATARQYVVTKKDVGTRLSIRVTGATASGATGDVTSSSLKAKRATAKVALTVKQPGPNALHVKARVRTKVAVTGKVVVTVVRNGRTVLSRRLALNKRGAVTVTAPAKASGRYVVKVKFLGTSAIAPASSSKTRVVR